MSKKLILSFFLSIFTTHCLIANPIKTFAQYCLAGTAFGFGTIAAQEAVEIYKEHNKPKLTFESKASLTDITNNDDLHSITKTSSEPSKNFWSSVSPDAKLIATILIAQLIILFAAPYVLSQCNQFTLHKSGTIKENFNTVAGNTEAKEEVADLIDYLKYPAKFQKLGAKVPKGILLSGNPGTGKTLLARALAGEANCSFISCSGSDFVEMYVGTGAARVRNLFKIARNNGPCIIFIDEIDALASKRSPSSNGGNFEYNQTINQLLSEMDGFNKYDKPIIVIGATNNIHNLDPAILRPGRFDRTVNVSLPDVTNREAILKVHLQKIVYDLNIDIYKIAQTTPGFSGADLANLVNEAAIIATKKDLEYVTIEELEEAKDKVSLGSKSKTIKMTDQEKKCTAYHEAGHALILLLSPYQNNALNKVTILPQGLTLGTTHYMQEQELHGATKTELLAQINIALGGRAAEELIFNEISTGAYGDFEGASKIARAMICQYGMTDILGKQVLLSDKQYSEETHKKIDVGVTHILETQYDEVMNMLRTHKNKLETLAQALLEKETLYADEIYTLLNIPPRKSFKIT